MSFLNFFKKNNKQLYEHKCPTCGKYHSEYSVAFKIPDCQIDKENKDTYFSDDFCIANGESYFIRAILEIPIIGHNEPFLWGIWISQSKENYQFYKDNFKTDIGGRHTFGWFSNILPEYENTFGLETQLCFQNNGERPVVELKECDHQLYKDFINGITLERADELMKIFNKNEKSQ